MTFFFKWKIIFPDYPIVENVFSYFLSLPSFIYQNVLKEVNPGSNHLLASSHQNVSCLYADYALYTIVSMLATTGLNFLKREHCTSFSVSYVIWFSALEMARVPLCYGKWRMRIADLPWQKVNWDAPSDVTWREQQRRLQQGLHRWSSG